MNTDKVIIKGLVLKVASRCNLNCEYCYMYNLGDKSYQAQPKIMSQKVVKALLSKVRTYLTQSGSNTFRFIFHGGEPLLVKQDFYQKFVDNVNELLPAYIRVDYALQTNGVLLTEDWCKTLGNLNIRIGISLDGFSESDNKFRIDHQKRSSLNNTLAGLLNAQQSKYVKYEPGVLSVINLENNPEEMYVIGKVLNIRHINFALPHGTHDKLPNNFDIDYPYYADWLIRLFEIWFNDRDHHKPQIRIFNQILNLILGGGGSYDNFGTGQNVYLIIETNGDIEPQDSLKACGNGFTKTSLNVQTHQLQDSFENPLIKLCIENHQRICTQCEQCAVVSVCGGGFVTHRYSQKNDFNNPSIYCKDLEKLIRHISMRIESLLIKSINPSTKNVKRQ
jgi:uncharacterized protein